MRTIVPMWSSLTSIRSAMIGGLVPLFRACVHAERGVGQLSLSVHTASGWPSYLSEHLARVIVKRLAELWPFKVERHGAPPCPPVRAPLTPLSRKRSANVIRSPWTVARRHRCGSVEERRRCLTRVGSAASSYNRSVRRCSAIKGQVQSAKRSRSE